MKLKDWPVKTNEIKRFVRRKFNEINLRNISFPVMKNSKIFYSFINESFA